MISFPHVIKMMLLSTLMIVIFCLFQGFKAADHQREKKEAAGRTVVCIITVLPSDIRYSKLVYAVYTITVCHTIEVAMRQNAYIALVEVTVFSLINYIACH